LGVSTILAPGVSVTAGITGVGFPFAAYFPATQFFSGDDLFQLKVTGVPEPASLGLSIIGLITFGMGALRRSQGNARTSVETSGSGVTHSTTPFFY
jgi:hypothetical protein